MRVPQTGDVLEGKYQLGEQLGSGGFATVYRATDLTVGRAVAVKILEPGDEGYTQSRAARFKREARVLAGLTDPHTLCLFDFGQTPDGVLFIVSELLEGADLSDVIEARGALPEGVAVHIARQVLLSLREAHAAGLLHRDIKPSNIRIYEYAGDPWRAKLMDFGVARGTGAESASLTRTGGVVGTPRYMPPEQLVGATLTPASDLFSVGLVIYEMLNGGLGSLRSEIAARRPVEVPGSPAIGAFVRQLLAFRAEERYPDAGAALAALDRLMSGSGELPAHGAAIPAGAVGLPARPRTATAPHHLPPASPPSEELVTLERASRAGVAAPRPWLLAVLGATAALAVLVLWASSRAEDRAPARAEVPPELLATRSALVRSPPPPPASSADVGTDGMAPARCGRLDATPGRDVWARTVAGVEELRWLTYVPRSYRPDAPHGLLFLMHTDGTKPDFEFDYTRIRPFADAHGLLVVAPEDPEFLVWLRDDIGARVRSVFDEVRADYCVDEARVFAVGNGTGSRAVEQLACEPWIKASVATSFRSRDATFVCGGTSPAPHLHIAPTKSSHLPVEGGRGCTGVEKVVSLATQERMWRDRNRCVGEPTVTQTSDGSSCYAWECAAPFVSCHAIGGHRWTGVRKRRSVDVFKCDGPPSDFPHLQVIGDFFEKIAPRSVR